MKHSLLFELLTPDERLLRQEVDAITAPGLSGYFGVLRGHMHFVTLLREGLITVRTGDIERTYEVGSGVIQVTPEKVVACVEKARLRRLY
jgi:F-type H+-transporting ATPase subunit epsilon